MSSLVSSLALVAKELDTKCLRVHYFLMGTTGMSRRCLRRGVGGGEGALSELGLRDNF